MEDLKKIDRAIACVTNEIAMRKKVFKTRPNLKMFKVREMENVLNILEERKERIAPPRLFD